MNTIQLLNGETFREDEILELMLNDEFYYGYLGKAALSSSSIKIHELSRYERLQYTKVLLPYIAPKMREYDVKNDLIDVPVIEGKNKK